MKVHQNKSRFVLAIEDAVGGRKGILGVEIQVAAADEVQHTHLHPAAVIHGPAPARGTACIVCRAENVGVFLQKVRDPGLAEGVVAQSDDIRPGGENILGVGGQEAVSCGVFPIGHYEVDALFPLQVTQVTAQKLHAVLARYISQSQYPKQHGVHSSVFQCLSYYYISKHRLYAST